MQKNNLDRKVGSFVQGEKNKQKLLHCWFPLILSSPGREKSNVKNN